MRLILFCILSVSIACSNHSPKDLKAGHKSRLDTLSGASQNIEPMRNEMPKILKSGKDYITIATSAYDKLYFGEGFAPYKIEPFEVAKLEQIIDSLLSKKTNGNFINKSVTDFKYQISSVWTAKQKLQSRVQAICNEEAEGNKWNSSRLPVDDGGDCYFSFIYDFTEQKIILFQINSSG